MKGKSADRIKIEQILLPGIMFIIGRGFVYDVNPFILPFFIGTYIQGGNIYALIIAGLLGMATTLRIDALIRYGIILILIYIACLIGTTGIGNGVYGRSKFSVISREFIYPVATAVILLTDITWYFVRGNIDLIPLICEGIIALCFAAVYEKAVSVFLKDFEKIVTDNIGLIAITVLYATVLYSLPVELFSTISVAETVAFYILFYVIYRFGINIGSTAAVVSGFILTVNTNEKEYLIFALAAAMVCSVSAAIIPFKKIAISVSFIITACIFAMDYWPYINSENGIRALISAVVVFILTPSRLMSYIDKSVRSGDVYGDSGEWGRLIIDRVSEFAKAFRRIEYTVAGTGQTGITFSEIGDVIEEFSTEFDNVVPIKKKLESKLVYELSHRGSVVKNIILLKNSEEHYEVYITLKMEKSRLLTAAEVMKVIEEEINIPLKQMNCSRNIVSHEFTLLAFEELPPFYMDIDVKKISKYDCSPSGDNYTYGEMKNGQTLLLLSDGMGSGEAAFAQSELLIGTMEELLSAGFDRDMSVKFINSYLSRRNKGEIFATLDMLICDCYTGYGRMYKQGAAATFVRRGDWIEVIKSTSLPVGIDEDALCETSIKKFYENDIIIMVSDGVLESIVFENKEDYLKEVIRKSDSFFADEIADDIITSIKNLNGRNLKDDATVMAAVLRKR